VGFEKLSLNGGVATDEKKFSSPFVLSLSKGLLAVRP
jgi:hypothetical protein